MKPIETQGNEADTESGMALLLVLWFVLVMSMITAMTMSRESESTQRSLNHHDVNSAQHMVDAGIYRTLALLMEGEWQARVPAHGMAFHMDHNGGLLRIHIARENMKLDPTMAQDDALSSVLVNHPHVAQRITEVRTQWLSTIKNNQRQSAKVPAIPSLSGLMDREDETQLRAFLSVHTAAISLQLGKSAKRTLSNRVGEREALPQKVDGTFAIDAQVITPNAVGKRYAVARVYTDARGAPQYHILEWK